MGGGKLQQLPGHRSTGHSLGACADGRPRRQSLGGTETDGLHILRDQRFRTMGAREGLSFRCDHHRGRGQRGHAVGGNQRRRTECLAPERESEQAQSKTYSVRDGLLSDVILSLAAAPNGDLWVGTPDGLNRIRGGTVDAFTSADGLPDDFIRSLLADADGSLWIGTRRGLTHWTGLNGGALSGARMETFTQANGLGSDLVGAMARDSNGDLWVATLAGLSRLQRRQDRELHHCQRPLQQRDHGAAGAQRMGRC